MANYGETVTDFIFLGSKITADGDCSHEIKKYLFLGKKFQLCANSRKYTLNIKSLQMVITAMKLKDAYSLEGKL